MLKFISLLGNTKYTPCRYYLDSPDGSTDICGTSSSLCLNCWKKGIVPDQVVVFTTENAYEKNWIRNHAKKMLRMHPAFMHYCRSTVIVPAR